jgi:Domain of unknown function (DUF1992)
VPSSSDHLSSVERQIEDAMGRGEFDRLSGMGRPIPGIDGDDQPDWWARKKIERERALQAALDAASAVQRAIPCLWALTDPAEVSDEVRRLNRLLEQACGDLPESQHPEMLDLCAVLEDWRRMHRVRSGLGDWRATTRRSWALGRSAHSPGGTYPIL